MISIVSLWLPILVAAVFVFFASFVLHMLVPWHKGDYRKVPAEDDVREALRRHQIPPGEYMVPCGSGPESMKDPAFLQKMKEGPVLLMTVLPSGRMDMGKPLSQWFVYCLLVGVLAAYVASRALAPGAHYLAVFRFAGVTAFVGYSLALWQDSIWHGRPWGTTARSTLDGLLYALLTGGTFGWLWPK